MLSSSRDNWERLVSAVVKRQQIWELCHQQSISTITSDDLSQQTLSFSSSNFESFSVPPSPLLPPKLPPISQVSNHGSSKPLIQKLFSVWYQIRKPKDQDFVGIPEDVANHLGLLQRFSLDELRVATRDFSKRIGWECVYRGWLDDGSSVAVKRTPKKSIQRIDQLIREVEISNMVAHPNVIHILGFCITPKEVMLVYPLMINGSVRSCIWGRDESQPPLNWPTRKEIALGVAKAVAYLHEEISDKKVIHRDIKPSNILLDEDFKAVVADFGLAIVAERDAPDVELDNVCGTISYISPEYLRTFRCSEKNDVYGYGVFLLALISGRNPITKSIEGVPLRDLVNYKYMESKWEEIVDAECTFNYMEDEVKLLVQIALLCTLYDPQKRPKMSEIVRVIEDADVLVDQRWEEWIKDEAQWVIDDDDDLVDQTWEEWIKDEAQWVIDDDDTFDLAAEELSGPR